MKKQAANFLGVPGLHLRPCSRHSKAEVAGLWEMRVGKQMFGVLSERLPQWSPRNIFVCPHRSHPHDLPLGSDLSHSIVTVISGEEHFEDYGEGNEADLFSDSLCNGESSFNSSSFLSPR